MIITVLVIIRWNKAKGNKTKEEEESECKENVPEANCSLPFFKMRKIREHTTQVPHTVTFSTLNTSTQATNDLNSLYCNLCK
ncbi:hypothetical protein AMECASPLE_034383 [Ameca splendens]|uniref:Uncharacterized protein n=1 Tax=Ameca splendens TaxID=208324 RepID=A0ABV0ZRY4_9TELE